MVKIRDVLVNLNKVVEEIGIQKGNTVLDYGCGFGSFSVPAARIVGEEGRVYALDIHPVALKGAEKKAQKNNITNIEFIQSDCDTGLDDESVDFILLYDVLEGLPTPQKQLDEFARILKPKGILCVKDMHFKDEVVLSKITESSIFKLETKSKKQFMFSKL
ncbi:MAG: class I SAM-dependent methyltransferase [Candidatus Heimdallarchaeaceae archaeon]|jgi:ubiquinone/menaquinone biosynthesis C-methylase UbiE